MNLIAEKIEATNVNLNHHSSFPVKKVKVSWSVPVEVHAIAKLSPGEGDKIYAQAIQRQQQHPLYAYEYREASAKIGNTYSEKNDFTAMYTFSVAGEPLVFHRHEGHRAITAISCSKGCLLKFSAATPSEVALDEQSFIDKMFVIEVPEDTLFTLRFNGMVWHEFGPKIENHPSFFAISVHTNELGGNLSEEEKKAVMENKANIPLLTVPASESVFRLLEQHRTKKANSYFLLGFDE